ncbi:MAG: hypothetical protein JWM68_796, partial [Verrucomicrobiales bacterium]|nr:hypothetical protein [Verrucomicrobiales bacterium]
VILIENASDGLLDELSLVKGRSNDGEEGQR